LVGGFLIFIRFLNLKFGEILDIKIKQDDYKTGTEILNRLGWDNKVAVDLEGTRTFRYPGKRRS
jgi:hypothetical protein